MAGQDENLQELTDKELIEKLKNILKCLEATENQEFRKPDEGDDWFKTRKEKLRVPEDARKEQLKVMLEEKMKHEEKMKQEEKMKHEEKMKQEDKMKHEKMKHEEQTKNLETVMNIINPDKGKAQDVKENKVNKEGKQPKIPSGESLSLECASQIDTNNIAQYGLLQGPLLEPFTLEMNMGQILIGCRCIKRDGMQADCKRKMCRGKRTCLQLPLPLCVPSGYGRLKQKEPKVYIGEVQSCPKEEVATQEKVVKTQKKRETPKKCYIDHPPVALGPKICDVHKRGKYYMRPYRKHQNTQTEEQPEFQDSPSKIYPVCPDVEEAA